MAIQTGFKDSMHRPICDGDVLEIIATNQYNGIVNYIDGIPYLETAFFNKPLADHLTAIDLEEVYIDNGVPDDTENSFFI